MSTTSTEPSTSTGTASGDAGQGGDGAGAQQQTGQPAGQQPGDAGQQQPQGQQQPAADDAKKDDTPPGADQLGDPGKKALDAMKAKWKAAERRAAEAEQAAADLRAMQDKTAEERAEIEREREVERAVLAEARKMVSKTSLKAAAKGLVVDPDLAVTLIHADGLWDKAVVSDDGEVENADDLIGELISNRSYLAAAQRDGRIGGSADAGARKTPPPPSVDEQIAEAQSKGDWRTVISLQNQKLAAAG